MNVEENMENVFLQTEYSNGERRSLGPIDATTDGLSLKIRQRPLPAATIVKERVRVEVTTAGDGDFTVFNIDAGVTTPLVAGDQFEVTIPNVAVPAGKALKEVDFRLDLF